MSNNSDRKLVISILVVVIVLGGLAFLLSDQSNASSKWQQTTLSNFETAPATDGSSISLSPVQTGPMNAFPGQLINESYFLGATIPSASYYEVTVTLNSSSYETVDAVPTYVSFLTPVGYYLLFSFVMPNDQPGMWWNVGFQIVTVSTSTVQEIQSSLISAQENQIWMTTKSASVGYDFMLVGSANFTFSSNVTEVVLYPVPLPGSAIVSTQVSSWRFLTTDNVLQVNFSIYEYIGDTGGLTTPRSITAYVCFLTMSNLVQFEVPISVGSYRINLTQGNGAYIMGITSNQIAEITSSINQNISMPISQLNAAVVAINGDVAEIQTSFGTMTAQLRTINATIESVKNGQAIITTNVGTIQTSLSSLSTTITAISAGEAEIVTNIGTVTASLNSLNASFEGINGTDAVISTEIGSIKVSLNSINATIFSIHMGMVEMNTSIGTVEVSLKSVNASIVSITGDTAKIMTSAGEINASLSDLNTSIFGSGSDIPWLNNSYAVIETCLGNITGTITNVSNNTASIATNLGVVTASVDSIKSQSGNGPSGDPPSLFDIIVILLLGALTIISTLAMLSSRSTLKIMGDKVK